MNRQFNSSFLLNGFPVCFINNCLRKTSFQQFKHQRKQDNLGHQAWQRYKLFSLDKYKSRQEQGEVYVCMCVCVLKLMHLILLSEYTHRLRIPGCPLCEPDASLEGQLHLTFAMPLPLPYPCFNGH